MQSSGWAVGSALIAGQLRAGLEPAAPELLVLRRDREGNRKE